MLRKLEKQVFLKNQTEPRFEQSVQREPIWKTFA